MGRKPIYATLRTYQPYIDAIRKDLNIPDNYYVNVRFTILRNKGGYASENEVVIDKRYSKEWTIEALMHEFRHIQQRVSGRYVSTYVKTKHGRYKYVILWDGVEYEYYNIVLARRKGNIKLYYDRPWEIDARVYEKEIDRLFPNLEIPSPRVYVGTTKSGTKFYKMKG